MRRGVFPRVCFLLSRSEAAFSKSLRLDSFFDPDLLDLPLDFLHVRRRARVMALARPRAGFVHDADRFVWQEPSRDVTLESFTASRALHPSASPCGAARISAGALFESDGFIDGRRVDFHRLEPPLQRRVLLDVFAIFTSVVAPTHCNSPRLSAGLMMFDASTYPRRNPRRRSCAIRL